MQKRLVVLTGAGISQESGLKTFRDSGGLWESHRIEEVATPEAWRRHPGLVLTFYNERRKQCLEARPNAGHLGIAALDEWFNVEVITQNVDDLHERAGSSGILHLHGEITKARSSADPGRIYPLSGSDLNLGDLCELGSQLRPHIVWFGEEVPEMARAIPLVEKADLLAIVGTSLAVYPAAGLVSHTRPQTPVFVVDPGNPCIGGENVTFIREKAGSGVKMLTGLLLAWLEQQTQKI